MSAGSSESLLADRIAEVDEWLDGGVSALYAAQPCAQHWARVAKVTEEAGEAIAALIAWTGQNPRKEQRPEAKGEMLDELADTAITAILGMQHFVKDADETLRLVKARFEFLYERMHAHQAKKCLHSPPKPVSARPGKETP